MGGAVAGRVVLKISQENAVSKEVLNHSYEDMKFQEKSTMTGNKIRYYFKYKIFYKLYTYLLFSLNFIKKIILFRF